jgi:hypothetical protein
LLTPNVSYRYIQSQTDASVNEDGVALPQDGGPMAEQPEVHEEHDHVVSILVNDQPVHVDGPKVTGLQIKEAAIRAGLQIDLGFQVIEELPHNRTRVVGDDEIVQVRDGSRFLALAPDDNS